MLSNHYDVIVIGVGAMGASACWHLAKKNYCVLGLEQFDIPHEQGSHAGQSRIIRKAYFEHSDYVPLLQRAYHNWTELENLTDSRIYYKTGLAYFGSADAPMMKGSREAAARYDIPLEVLPQGHYPMFHTPAHYQTLFEPDAGFVIPEKAITVFVSDAIKHGADIQAREKVLEWKNDGIGISVSTNRDTYRADRLIICAGAWASKVIPALPATLKVTRQIVGWMNPKKWNDFLLGNFPCWFLNDAEGMFYGFPILPAKDFGGPVGLKVALHKRGVEVDPDQVHRDISKADEDMLRDFLRKYIPEAEGSILSLKSCLYTNSDDDNFIVDHVPGTDNKVVVAAGFSGHGFKFASVIGEIVADLAIKGGTELPVGFLRLGRFG